MDKSCFEDEKIFSELKKFEEERKKLFVNYIIRITTQALCYILISIFLCHVNFAPEFNIITLIASMGVNCFPALLIYIWSNNTLFKKYFETELDYLNRLKTTLTPKLLKHYKNVRNYHHESYFYDGINRHLDDAICFIDDRIVINNNNKITVVEEGIFNGERKIQISHEIDKKINSKITISRIGLFSITLTLFIRFFVFIFITISSFCLLFLTYLHIKSFKNIGLNDFILDSLWLLMMHVLVFGFIYQKFKDFIKKLKHNVNLESIDFCKNYKVTAEDQIEARYILTPVFIETLNRIKSIYGAKQIHCTIERNEMFLVITTNKNLFEIGSIYKTLLDKKVIEKFNKDIDILLNLVECLG